MPTASGCLLGCDPLPKTVAVSGSWHITLPISANHHDLPNLWSQLSQTRPAMGCSPDAFTAMTALGVELQQMRAMATRAPTLHETTQHSIGLMLIWSFIAVTVLVTAFPFFAVFH